MREINKTRFSRVLIDCKSVNPKAIRAAEIVHDVLLKADKSLVKKLARLEISFVLINGLTVTHGCPLSSYVIKNSGGYTYDDCIGMYSSPNRCIYINLKQVNPYSYLGKIQIIETVLHEIGHVVFNGMKLISKTNNAHLKIKKRLQYTLFDRRYKKHTTYSFGSPTLFSKVKGYKQVKKFIFKYDASIIEFLANHFTFINLVKTYSVPRSRKLYYKQWKNMLFFLQMRKMQPVRRVYNKNNQFNYLFL